MNHSLLTATSFLAIALITGTAAFAESQIEQDPKAEAQTFLASPTSLAQATATAEAAAGGKLSAIEYQTGENGMPDLIMAVVTLPDGTEKSVAINPVDGKVMTVTLASNDMTDGENGADGGSENGAGTGADGENTSN